MYLHGQFVNKKNETITVKILTGASSSTEIEIGGDDGVFFTDNPVEITCEVNDTFDHLIRLSATIRLLTRSYIPDLFCASCRDAIVNIYRGEDCLFAGFVEPQTYSQNYNEVYDELEINCVDVISALQFSNFKNIGASGVLYGIVKANAGQSSLLNIINDIFEPVLANIDIDASVNPAFYYDGSRAIDSDNAHKYTIFSDLSVSELLFLGDTEDDVWTQEAVIDEVMRYLNLHIVQQGFDFYIFAWDTMKANSNISWGGLYGETLTTTRTSMTFSQSNVADCNTQISIGEIYNQLSLTCDIEGADVIIESPLDSDHLDSPFNAKQWYCTEYSADGNGMQAISSIIATSAGKSSTYDNGNVTDWYLRVMTNENWKFPAKVNGVAVDDLVEHFCADGTNQQSLPNWLGQSGNLGAAVISVGSVEKSTKQARTDDSPVAKVDLSECMVIAVNGEGQYNAVWLENFADTFPTGIDIKGAIPVARYTGAFSGAFSPVDDSIVNYIVFSGKIVLNPLMPMTAPFPTWEATADKITTYWHHTVYCRDNEDGRYYLRRYLKATKPTDTAVTDNATSYGFIPFSDTGRKWAGYRGLIPYNQDTLSKVPILACMLIIGNKCLVEVGHAGTPSDYEWHTYKTRQQCESDDEYYMQSFTLGFNPAAGEDHVIGEELDIQNNITIAMGLDVEGTAIPIKKSDNVSGDVQFMILGAVNIAWKRTSLSGANLLWPEPFYGNPLTGGLGEERLLPLVSNIIVKGFEAKIVSDNAGIEPISEKDIVYLSDTDEDYVNKKDDLDMKINSALTGAECAALGVKNAVCTSTPLFVSTGDGVTAIYDAINEQTAKPEKLYVDAYWHEYHLPRVLMTQSVEDVASSVNIFAHYTHPALNKTFFVQGISRNLIEATATLNLKEIDND